MNRWTFHNIPLLPLLVLQACITVGPDYRAPEIHLPDQWSAGPESDLFSTEANPERISKWWSALSNEALSNVIEAAVTNNPSLKESLARVTEAMARRGLARSNRFPKIDASGAASSVTSKSESTSPVTPSDLLQSRDPGALLAAESLKDQSDTSTRSLYEAGLAARWEIDLFGGIARSVEAADADLNASHATHRDLLISLLSEIALAYVELRTFERRLTIAVRNLKAQEETLQLVRWRVEAGLVGGLDEEQALLNVQTTQARIPPIEQGISESRNRIAALSGFRPDAIPDGLLDPLARGKIPVPPARIAVGIPADLLRRRPDIRQAERELAAETARVGVATAELYPQFHLPGSITYQSASPGGETRTGSLGIGFNWNLFSAGAIRRNIDIANARVKQRLYQYESTVLGALEETESALAAYAGEENHRRSLGLAVGSAESVARLTEQKYAVGLSDFLEVLQAQQNLLSLQDQLAVSEGESASRFIRIYRALGGGWVPEPDGEDRAE
jgi:NodT family efflux transporter outer membrane factor (OMF) lipoprotein